MHVDLDTAFEGSRGRVEYVERAPSTVPGIRWLAEPRSQYGTLGDGGTSFDAGTALPVVVGAVFIGDDDDGDLGIVLDRVGAVSGVGEVFLGVRTEGFQNRFAASWSAVCDSTKLSPNQSVFLTPSQTALPRARSSEHRLLSTRL